MKLYLKKKKKYIYIYIYIFRNIIRKCFEKFKVFWAPNMRTLINPVIMGDPSICI